MKAQASLIELPARAQLRGLALACVLALVIASCSGGGNPNDTAVPATAAGPSGSVPPPSNPVPPETPAGAPLTFGVQTHFGQGWSPDLVPVIASAGIASVRDELYWELVEPAAGRFAFPANYDAYMAALKDRGVDPLVELTFENDNYDGGQTPYTASGFSGYARYATTLLSRYGSQIKAVEVWNEYNGSFVKGPAANDRAGTYVKMLQAAYAAIKGARPDVTVVGGATSGVPLPYWEKLFAGGALNYLDAISVHPYRFDEPPEGIETQFAALQNLMTSYGAAKPVWVTEIGWGLHDSLAPGDPEIDEGTQARYLVRAFALLASAGVQHIFWYEYRDDSSGPHLGLVRNDATSSARPALAAFRTLDSRLRHATFAGRDPANPGLYSLRFATTDGRTVRVLWSLSPVTVAIPSGTSVVDLNNAPVATESGAVTVDDSPVFVTGLLADLPGAGTPPAVPIADSASGFSLQQGQFGWSYGYTVGDSGPFQLLSTPQVTDWHEQWTDKFPFISITNVDQHPSRSGNTPVWVVRRWTSPGAGTFHVHARFKVGTQGDGVRVRVTADGATLYSAALNTGTSVAGEFDLRRSFPSGSSIDFAVDPGPAANIDYDATEVSVTIERLSP